MMIDYIKLIRPNHWIKNVLVFVPVLFAGEFFDLWRWERSALAFVAFCLLASAVYVINDIFDRKVDAMHPTKRLRPIASGRVGIRQATVLAVLLAAAPLTLSYFFIPQALVVLAVYFILNLLYSLRFKHLPVFDMVFIAAFYLIRIEAGGLASDIVISKWLVLCIIFVSLLLIAGKRMGELKHENGREVLDSYDAGFLKPLAYMFAGLAVVSYGVYSVLGVESSLAVYSVFFVVFGVVRYLYISDKTADVEYPEKIIIKDRVLLYTLIFWVLYMAFCVIGTS